MKRRRALIAGLMVLALVGGSAALGASDEARLTIDGVLIASHPLAPGTHTIDLIVDGTNGVLLDQSFQVEVPNPIHMVIESDTMLTNETLTLRPGDSIEFRNGARLMFAAGASADWQGTPTATWSNDGLTQNLGRDIDIFGQGDIMFAAGSLPSTIRYVDINLQPKLEVGHYPLHWHFVGDGSRGTLVEGVVVRNSTNRAFVPHASHGITFRDTIAKTIAGEAYWWDPPPPSSLNQVNNSKDILYDRALADGITNGVGDIRGFQLAAFDLGAGTGNTVRNSVARNINPSHVKSCSGFVWPGISIHQPGTWVFQNNKTFGSRCHGIFVWQNTSQPHVVDGFVSDDGIEHGAYNNFYEYRNITVPYVIAHAVDWKVTSGSIGEVVAVKHQSEGTITFTNVAVGKLIISNGAGIRPGHYVFNNTGLTCANVVWSWVVPGTTVMIDGQVCTS